MRQDSETNIIVFNTALKYKIQRNTQNVTRITVRRAGSEILSENSYSNPM